VVGSRISVSSTRQAQQVALAVSAHPPASRSVI
jgi:hypothetical protein